MPKKIIHLLPKDGLGGAEVAARSMIGTQRFESLFFIRYISRSHIVNGKPGVNVFNSVNNPALYVLAAFRLIGENPSVLISSLWRSMPIAIITKLVRPRMKLVVFLHSAAPAHFIDGWLTTLAMQLADDIWADSPRTLHQRAERYGYNGRVISFVLRKIPAARSRTTVGPRFVFWGRLTFDKGIDLALRFIEQLKKTQPDLTFDIWGPDKGEKSKIEVLIEQLGLRGSVRIMGELEHHNLSTISKQYSFYLQLSRREGMAMSVVEAMQRGLVPVVTAVGEIGSYCRSGVNSWIVEPSELEHSVAEVETTIRSLTRYQQLSRSAMETWKDAKEYRQDVMEKAELLMQTDLH